jgi:hypothetical protein
MEPGGYQDTPCNKDSALHSMCKIMEGLKQRGCTIYHGGRSARTGIGLLSIHLLIN